MLAKESLKALGGLGLLSLGGKYLLRRVFEVGKSCFSCNCMLAYVMVVSYYICQM